MNTDRVGTASTQFGGREQVFKWRPPHEQHQKDTTKFVMAWVLAAITLAVIAFLFWQLWGSFASEPAFAEKWKKLTW